MTESEAKALQAREKAEVSTMTEQTKPGLVFTPDVDIFETEKELTLLADMPGVKPAMIKVNKLPPTFLFLKIKYPYSL
jgi:HSP20 family protein